MEHKTKIIIGSVAGAIALGGIAFAAQGYNQHQKMKRFFSPQKIFAQIDVNGDKAASRDEVSKFTGKYFARADANGDGKLTKTEIVAAIEASEMPSRVKRRAGRIADRLISQGDVNQDGNLTRAELDNRLGKFQAIVDWNDDNRIEMSEVKRLRGSFGRGWRNGDRQ